MARMQKPLFTLEETTVVPDEALHTHIRNMRERGGRLRRTSICTQNGQPAYAVTFGFPA